ncbi:hypothetical protein CDL12_03097 [Handroanthus impetiginosus]|uniref:Uncharacterized protein n=1 Tax=Handroanthus impetiginosus TaxID=429701 RepID=A0A2G9HNX9_9LAMI|nr:hypothetical protein CDL12_08089 [Handroanthus impetiginosus]PIN24176.1 hypothetical protein CDL12_03097 [Handroanthus impetiginosus]
MLLSKSRLIILISIIIYFAIMLTSSSTSRKVSRTQYGKNSQMKRKQRIMTYKAYAVEGKVKASIRSTFQWIKNKYSSIVHGY